MPTHEELPDPEAWWRLTGDEDLAPAAGPQPAARRTNAVVLAIIVAILAALAIDVVGSDPLYDAMAWFVEFMDSGSSWHVMIFIFVGAIPMTLLHELGHALAARALLDAPVSVAVGSYGTFARLRLGEISVSLNAIASPARVGGSATFDASRATARDMLLIALAGPAASAAGLVVAALALAALPDQGIAHGVAWAAVLASAFGVLNLIPLTLRERRDGPSLQTDGRLALDAARVLRSLR